MGGKLIAKKWFILPGLLGIMITTVMAQMILSVSMTMFTYFCVFTACITTCHSTFQDMAMGADWLFSKIA